MNIFVLHYCPKRAARMQCDKHIVKMPLETAQMLCTVLHRYGLPSPYRATHKAHPCTVWAGDTRLNFGWLGEHGLALCREYTRRYKRTHKCEAVIRDALLQIGCIPAGPQTPFPQAMPEEYRSPDAVESYRQYYQQEKARIAVWKYSDTPAWWGKEVSNG